MSKVTAYCPNCGFSFQVSSRKGLIGSAARIAGYGLAGAAIGAFTGGAGLLALGGIAAGSLKNISSTVCKCPKCGATVNRPQD